MPPPDRTLACEDEAREVEYTANGQSKRREGHGSAKKGKAMERPCWVVAGGASYLVGLAAGGDAGEGGSRLELRVGGDVGVDEDDEWLDGARVAHLPRVLGGEGGEGARRLRLGDQAGARAEYPDEQRDAALLGHDERVRVRDTCHVGEHHRRVRLRVSVLRAAPKVSRSTETAGRWRGDGGRFQARLRVGVFGFEERDEGLDAIPLGNRAHILLRVARQLRHQRHGEQLQGLHERRRRRSDGQRRASKVRRSEKGIEGRALTLLAP